MTNRLPIAVEIHGTTNPHSGMYGRHHDVSQFVTSCSWSSMIRSPWETINVSLTIPLSMVDVVIPGELIEAGSGGSDIDILRGGTKIAHSAFWLVVRDMEKIPDKDYAPVALAWGKVDSITVVRGVDQSSGGHYCEVTIAAGSWASLLEETKLVVTYLKAGDIASAAFLHPDGFMSGFLKSLRVLLKQDTGMNLGRAFQTFWKVGLNRGIHWLNLPDTLFLPPGSSVKKEQLKKAATKVQTDRVPFSEIPIIYSNARATQYAPTFAVGNSVLHVPGGLPRNIGGWGAMMTMTWWSALTSMFEVNPNITELFPFLDVPDYGDAVPGKVGLAVTNPTTGTTVSGTLRMPKAGVIEPKVVDDSFAKTMGEAWQEANEALSIQSRGFQRIVRALGGSRPGVMYRMKPFCTGFALDEIKRWFEGKEVGAKKDTSMQNAADNLMESAAALVNSQFVAKGKTLPFESVQGPLPMVLGKPNSYQIFAHDIFDYTETADDASIVNGVVVYPPNMTGAKGALSWGTGLVAPPIFHWESPRLYGLRMFEVNWPFLSDQKTISTDYFAGLTDMIYAIVANPGVEPVIMSGGASIVYRPRARAGHWFHLSQRSHFKTGLIHRNPGATQSWISDRHGYASSVTHTVSIGQNGEYRTGTEIQFERILRQDRTQTEQSLPILGAPPAQSAWAGADIKDIDPFEYE